MRVDLPNNNEYAKINNLQEIKSPILFDQNAGPHPEGLISNEIFGYNTKSRKETFAYINLKKHFLNPHVYKSMKRFFRSIDDIASGKKTFILRQGKLVEDASGETGLDWLYSIWDKINWRGEDDTASRKERIDVLTNYKKDEVWMEKFIVCPPFYRDVLNTSSGGETGELNGLYVKLIRQVSMLDNSMMFDFAFYNIEYQIQCTIVEIYDYFKIKLQKKQGLIRKALMSKTVDYGSRTIITAPIYSADRYEDMPVDAAHMAVPLSQVCALLYPQMIREIKNWFSQAVMLPRMPIAHNGETVFFIPEEPENQFNDQYIDKALSNYINNPSSRFDKIYVEGRIVGEKELRKKSLYIVASSIDDATPVFNRPMCWTDLLYMLACEVVKGKCAMFTRYPELGTFFNKINVVCTNQSMPVKIGETEYKWYPVVDYSLTHEQLTSAFKDSVSFDNCYCANASADYDGDQVTIKVLWSNEANEEAEKFIYSKQNILNANGMSNKRTIEAEAVQTLYVMTKEPRKDQKMVTNTDLELVLNTPIEKMGYQWFINLLGCTYIGGQAISAKYNGYDKILLKKSQYKYLKSDIETTIGRLIFNRYILESCGLIEVVGYINDPITSKRLGKLEDQLSEEFLNDKINGEQFIEYLSRRAYLGLKLNAMITTSYSKVMMTTPKKVQKLKKQLIEKNKEALDAGDINVAEKIEKELLSVAKEEIKDDPANDLFDSGARGSFGNNYKNTNIMRGAVYNRVKDKYDIVTSCFSDGISIKDSSAMANSLVESQYPKSVGTCESGYLQKELIQLMQTEIVDKAGTDCHTKRTIDITITDHNASGYLFRYIVENNKLVLLTKENMNKYIGKVVKMRSPLACINKHGTCNVCVGELPYKMGVTNVGLQASSIGTRLTSLNMKKFHDAQLYFSNIELDDFMLST